MKEGVWGIGLLIISLITFAVVGTMSNITTTNQQDYEFMKSSVESAMYDARDEIQYRRGICVCSKQGGTPKQIENVEQYKILKPNDESECDGMENGTKKFEPSECRFMHGEYVVNADIFTESLISRFGTVAKNQETYDITVQDVIEYPPKASVEIVYYQYLFEAMGDGHAPIKNRMDAIFEGKDIKPDRPEGSTTVKVRKINCSDELVNQSLSVVNISNGDTKTVNSGSSVTLNVGSYILTDGTNKTAFTVDPNDISDSIDVYVRTMPLKDCPCTEPEETTTLTDIPKVGDTYTVLTHHYVVGTTTRVHDDDSITVNGNASYSTSYYSTSNLYSKYRNEKYAYNGVRPTNASGVATGDVVVTYYYTKDYTTPDPEFDEIYHFIRVHHYVEGTETSVHNDDYLNIKDGDPYTTSPYATSQLYSRYSSENYSFNGVTPSNASGTSSRDDTVIYYYKKYETPPPVVVETYEVRVHHYKEGSTTKVQDDSVMTKKKGESYTTSPVSQLYDSYSGYTFNGVTPSNASGVVNGPVSVSYYYNKPATPPGGGGGNPQDNPGDPSGNPGGTPETPPEETTQTPTVCKWHYYNTYTTCATTNPYQSSHYTGTSPSCAQGFEKQNEVCGDGNNQFLKDSFVSIFDQIRILVAPNKPGKTNTCSWDCVKGHGNKTFVEANLTPAAHKSGRGTSEYSGDAVIACNVAQSTFCNAQSGYAGYVVNGCVAVRDYYCHGYIGKEKIEETKYDQTEDPRSVWCSGKTACSCDCLG